MMSTQWLLGFNEMHHSRKRRNILAHSPKWLTYFHWLGMNTHALFWKVKNHLFFYYTCGKNKWLFLAIPHRMNFSKLWILIFPPNTVMWVLIAAPAILWCQSELTHWHHLMIPLFTFYDPSKAMEREDGRAPRMDIPGSSFVFRL